MADETTTETPAETPETGSPAATIPETTPEKPEGVEGEVSELRAALAKANKDAERNRRKAETAAAEAHATAKAEMAKVLAAALGVETPTEADPEALTRQLQDQSAETKAAKLELAVFKAAGTEFNAAALLDSRSFVSSLTEVDPTDSEAVAAVVKAAADANPAFKTTPGTRLPAPTPAPGSSGGGAPDAEAVKRDAIKRGDWRTAIAIENQKLVTAPRP